MSNKAAGRVMSRYNNNALLDQTAQPPLLTGEQYIITSTFDGDTTLAYYNGVEEDDKFFSQTHERAHRATVCRALHWRTFARSTARRTTAPYRNLLYGQIHLAMMPKISEDINDYYSAF